MASATQITDGNHEPLPYYRKSNKTDDNILRLFQAGVCSWKFYNRLALIGDWHCCWLLNIYRLVYLMLMILKAVDFSEQITHKPSPKNIFKDMTFLSTERKIMWNALFGLDELVKWSRMQFRAKKLHSLIFIKGMKKEVQF